MTTSLFWQYCLLRESKPPLCSQQQIISLFMMANCLELLYWVPRYRGFSRSSYTSIAKIHLIAKEQIKKNRWKRELHKQEKCLVSFKNILHLHLLKKMISSTCQTHLSVNTKTFSGKERTSLPDLNFCVTHNPLNHLILHSHSVELLEGKNYCFYSA